MRRRIIFRFAAAAVLCAAWATAAQAQDFRQSFNLAPGGSITIKNVSGDINISGYDGAGVEVTAYKEGRDRDRVSVENLSTANRVSLRADYEEHCNCDAGLRFEVRVPRSVRFNFDKISTASGNLTAENVTGSVEMNTASGDVTLSGVSGEIRASTASGTVKVKDAAGNVNASSASGDVEVELTRIEGDGDMRFSTASGNVHVRLPASIDARVEMSTVSGSLETNLPIEVRKDQYGPGSRARGQLGGGSRLLKISSASGDVSLKSL
jgi:opacity protein-like surface antigen